MMSSRPRYNYGMTIYFFTYSRDVNTLTVFVLKILVARTPFKFKIILYVMKWKVKTISVSESKRFPFFAQTYIRRETNREIEKSRNLQTFKQCIERKENIPAASRGNLFYPPMFFIPQLFINIGIRRPRSSFTISRTAFAIERETATDKGRIRSSG